MPDPAPAPLYLQIADGLVAAVRGRTWSLAPLLVRRAYVPVYYLDRDLEQVHVTVVPRSRLAERASRGERQKDVLVDIGVQKRLDEYTSDALSETCRLQLDRLAAFVDELDRTLIDLPLDGVRARCLGIAVDPIYAPDHLEQRGQFTSVLTLTYRSFG